MTEAGRTPAQRDALSRKDLLPITILLLVGSAAFVRLLALPPFEDEGTELRWIWRVIEAGDWLQPLADGKPLQVWPMALFVWLGLPPLGVMRAVNVLVGMIGSVLLYRLALCTTENRDTAFVSAGLFAICPFVIYLQRLCRPIPCQSQRTRPLLRRCSNGSPRDRRARPFGGVSH